MHLFLSFTRKIASVVIIHILLRWTGWSVRRELINKNAMNIFGLFDEGRAEPTHPLPHPRAENDRYASRILLIWNATEIAFVIVSLSTFRSMYIFVHRTVCVFIRPQTKGYERIMLVRVTRLLATRYVKFWFWKYTKYPTLMSKKKTLSR